MSRTATTTSTTTTATSHETSQPPSVSTEGKISFVFTMVTDRDGVDPKVKKFRNINCICKETFTRNFLFVSNGGFYE